jgi:CubicO group peptidase (beta-lactamase class C family)
MPNYQEIQNLSEQPTLTSRHVCDEHNIKPNAIQAVHRVIAGDGNVGVRSSLIHGTRSPYHGSEPIDEDATIAVGSVTKMFTSAALLKLWDQELTAKKSGGLADGQTENFPDGIDTRLSHFMTGLKAKFPDCSYLTTIEGAPHFAQVTLRDLLNHTHALGGDRDDAQIAKVLMDNPDKQFSCAELVQFLNYNTRDEFGKFKYGSLGTELSGMIMELVTGKTYDQVLQDEVLNPVGATRSKLKNVNDADANSTSGYCYITPMELGDGDSKKEYSGEINFNTTGNGLAAGGLRTAPEDADKFIRKFLSKEAGKSSLFENAEVVGAL